MAGKLAISPEERGRDREREGLQQICRPDIPRQVTTAFLNTLKVQEVSSQSEKAFIQKRNSEIDRVTICNGRTSHPAGCAISRIKTALTRGPHSWTDGQRRTIACEYFAGDQPDCSRSSRDRPTHRSLFNDSVSSSQSARSHQASQSHGQNSLQTLRHEPVVR